MNEEQRTSTFSQCLRINFPQVGKPIPLKKFPSHIVHALTFKYV